MTKAHVELRGFPGSPFMETLKWWFYGGFMIFVHQKSWDSHRKMVVFHGFMMVLWWFYGIYPLVSSNMAGNSQLFMEVSIAPKIHGILMVNFPASHVWLPEGTLNTWIHPIRKRDPNNESFLYIISIFRTSSSFLRTIDPKMDEYSVYTCFIPTIEVTLSR